MEKWRSALGDSFEDHVKLSLLTVGAEFPVLLNSFAYMLPLREITYPQSPIHRPPRSPLVHYCIFRRRICQRLRLQNAFATSSSQGKNGVQT